MASQGYQVKLANGLTPKEEAFKQTIIQQIRDKGSINGTEAALQNYETTDRPTAGVIAYENLKKPQIKKSIEEELNSIGLSRSQLMDNIGKIATKGIKEDQKVSPETILKSNIELLKLIGAYPKTSGGGIHLNIQQNVANLGYSEAKKELETMSSEASEFIEEADA